MSEFRPKFRPGIHITDLREAYMPKIQTQLDEAAKEHGKHKPYSSEPFKKRLSARKEKE